MTNWWENDFATVRGNKLYLAGRRAVDLAARYGTPLYVYGQEAVRARYRYLDKILAAHAPVAHWICYAMKANPHPALLALLRRCGARIDAVSPNEVDAAMAAGFPPERILYTGTSVSRDDLERVFAVDGLTVNIDAAEQLDVMAAVRRRVCPKKRVRVSVRWNPGIGSGFNPRVVTAGARASDGTPIKFGVEERKVAAVFERARALGFAPVGLHHHLGSGWVREDFPAAREAVGKIVRKARELEDLGHRLEFLDFGGGFGPRYTKPRGSSPSSVFRPSAGPDRPLGLGPSPSSPGSSWSGRPGRPPAGRVPQGELRQPLRLRQRRDLQHRAAAGHLSPGPPRDRQRLPRPGTPRPADRGRAPLRDGRRLRQTGSCPCRGRARSWPCSWPAPTAGAWPRPSTSGTSRGSPRLTRRGGRRCQPSSP